MPSTYVEDDRPDQRLPVDITGRHAICPLVHGLPFCMPNSAFGIASLAKLRHRDRGRRIGSLSTADVRYAAVE
jgi:hypothetical protein